MDVFMAIETRRSIRKYRDAQIPEDLLKRILEAARLAPSAANRQPWAMVVVQDPERKRRLARACSGFDYVSGCAVFIVCFGDKRQKWCQVDGAIAMEHVALTAWENGIGSCWIGQFNEDHLKSIIRIPPEWEIIACMTLGYPNETPARRPRKNLDDLVYREVYTPHPGSPEL
ncbi:MAG TPA: nitroreductase family protein [Methanocella sp.]|nr:nitroreductase family protein [Methanocella sp.]